MWPFTKKAEISPDLLRFAELMRDPRCLEWFEKVDSGATRSLPLDVASNVQEAMVLSFSITSVATIQSSELIRAVKRNDLGVINKRLHNATRRSVERALDASRPLKRIIEWANDHNIPELRAYNAFFYKECGVPRDIHRLQGLRYLLVNTDCGITEIPDEIAHLQLLQGICLSNNSIRSIPKALFGCPALTRLDLEDNQITRIEDGIHALSNLTALDLSGNKLSHVTPDIARMPSLRSLDISNQRTDVDIMRAKDTPLSEASLDALYSLVDRIDVKY